MVEGGFAGPSAREIAEMLRSEARSLGVYLFPNAREVAGFLEVGSLHGEPGKSLKIRLRGLKAGTWADYSTSDSDPKGKGDMLALIQHTVAGGDIKRAIAEAKKWLNLDTMDPGAIERQRKRAAEARERAEAEAASDAEKRRRNAERLWHFSAPLTASSPAVRYLEGRGIDFKVLGKFPGAVRFHAKVTHAELSRQVPAMVTACVADGEIRAAHLTYLEYRDGGWCKLAGVERSKIIRGPFKGAHIPLWKGGQKGKLELVAPGTPIEASEGIEDGLSYAMANLRTRVIAGASLGNIGEIALPPQAGTLTILAQRDEKPQPRETLEKVLAAQQLRARQDGSGRAVKLRFPPEGIKDWNDWLNAPVGGVE